MLSTILMLVAVFVACATMGIRHLKRPDPALSSRKINIVSSSPNLDRVLGKYQRFIGDDYTGYRNHVYRVLTYALHYLDGEKAQEGLVLKYLPVIESALAYHDIALWTDQTLTYLEPSLDRAKWEFESTYAEDELRLLHNIIYWHHKITPFEGENAAIVNAVRKADWIDATEGIVNHGMPPAHIQTVTAAIPDAGFHDMLQSIGKKLYGGDIKRIVTETLSIFRW
jgi:hypothetical protein